MQIIINIKHKKQFLPPGMVVAVVSNPSRMLVAAEPIVAVVSTLSRMLVVARPSETVVRRASFATSSRIGAIRPWFGLFVGFRTIL